jgi:GNAT superfamily N-acetyltransferase
VKKPEMTYEFISHKNRARFIQFANQAWLLGLHEDGYLRDTLLAIWSWRDKITDSNLVDLYDFVVARADGAIVGIIMLEHSVSTIDTYVIPSWRKRGVASGLVKALRGFVGDKKVLCGWTGVKGQGWENYYARNFILHLGQDAPKELVEQHGDKYTANKVYIKSLKLKMSAAYRKSKTEGVK